MGLFDLFRKKEPVKEEPREEEPQAIYSGMRVEVTTQDGQMLFAAKMMDLREKQAKLYQYSEVGVAVGEEPVKVRIRGYNDRSRKAVYMEGVISRLPKHVWQVEELLVERVGNDRAFFRLDLDLDATVTTFGGFGSGEYHCRLVNISVGGACIKSSHLHHEGDKFLLKVKLMEDRDISTMFCEVMRVTVKGEGAYEYGCRFLELTENDEERITQNIFAFQRMKRGG